jgi:predicted CXXCH cytochrome family protein
MGLCFTCHASHGSENAGMTKRVGAALCTACHAPTNAKLVAKHPNIRMATATCTYCHDPHAQKKGLHALPLLAEHPPFSTGDCNSCHVAKSGGTLVQKLPDLCLQCHDDMAAALKKPHVHPALADKQQCLVCHGPHGGSAPKALRREATKLCFTCHDPKPFQGTYRHAALDRGCTTCHDPHSSGEDHLLKDRTITLCMGCHTDMSKHFHPYKDKIDPRTGQELACTGCHEPHSSEFEHLLVADPEAKLCLRCHDPSMGPKPRRK